MHFKGLDLNLLVILDALLEEQSVTKAAIRLNVSQPAVSAALAKLRWHTGDELLQKVGRSFKLTAGAQAMARQVKEILIQIESTLRIKSAFDPSLTDRTFSIAMTSYCAQVLLPRLIMRIAAFPCISCLVEEISTDSLGRIKNGNIDSCITFQQTRFLNPRESLDELSYTRLFSDIWVLVAGIGNDIVMEGMPYEEFCALPYVATRLGRDLPSFVERTLDQQMSRPRVTMSVPSFELAITCAVNSGCLAVVPSLLIDDRVRPFVKVLKPPLFMPAIEEFLVWHSRDDAEPGHTWFRELVLEAALELQPSALHREGDNLVRFPDR